MARKTTAPSPFSERPVDRLIRLMETREYYTVITYAPDLCRRLALIEERHFTPGTPAANGYEAIVLDNFPGFPIVTLMRTATITAEQLRTGLLEIGWPPEMQVALEDLRPEAILVLAEPDDAERANKMASALLAGLRHHATLAKAQWN